MRPIFKEPAIAFRIGEFIEDRLIINPEPREDRKIVRAREHIDGIDLQKAQLIDELDDG